MHRGHERWQILRRLGRDEVTINNNLRLLIVRASVDQTRHVSGLLAATAKTYSSFIAK